MTLPLLLQIGLGRYRHTPGAHGFGRRTLGLSQKAERRFSRKLRRSIEAGYPAHLHVNVDEGHRHMGIGRRLIENYLGDLRSCGIAGVHLFCAAGPLEFYSLLGFEILGSAQFRGASIFCLGRKL
jgi:GNAT superfamily N-acetyltransferase